MAWTVPKTFVVETALTAAELNVHIRDNLLETAPAQASTDGQLLVTSGTNSVTMREPIQADAGGTVTTSNTSPTSLSGGPSLTFDHNGAFLVFWSARMRSLNTGDGGLMQAGPEIIGSGSAFHQASINRSVRHNDTSFVRYGSSVLHHSLEPGEDTVELLYWVNDGTTDGEWAQRTITVIPL